MKKISLFLICLTLVFSLFVVPSFALTENTVDFLFAEELSFNDSFNGISESFTFESNGSTFKGINVMYRGYWVVEYVTIADNTVPVYTSDGGWMSDSFRTLVINSPVPSDSVLFQFLSINEYNPIDDGWYFIIRDGICDTVFMTDYDSLDGNCQLSVSLLSLAFTYTCIFMPLLVVLIVVKNMFGLRWF